MPRSKTKKSTGTSLRTVATAAKTGRGIRYSKEAVAEHVNRFRALSAKTVITQQKYADDNRISVGTLSRWLFESKEGSMDERPIRGLLSAGGSAGSAEASAEFAAPQKANGSEDSRVAALEADLAEARSEKQKMNEKLIDAMARNNELRLAIRNISGSL